METYPRVITVVKATGIGSTAKSAFDAALHQVNIHNFNLLPLSSVIPPNTKVVRRERFQRAPLPGSMQPVVMANITYSEPGEQISAGVGWRQAREGGIFVEVNLRDSQEVLLEELRAGVMEIASHREWEWIGDPEFETAEIIVPDNGKWASALVCAVYEWVQVWGGILDTEAVATNSSLAKGLILPEIAD
ncbi:MAG: pyruvoyl-dependent arginine decarboxylase [Candidatus Hodarchaeales archaeon]